MIECGAEHDGLVKVCLGSASGVSTSGSTLSARTTGERFGSSLASGRDVDGDGYDDVAGGAYGYGSSNSQALVWQGASSCLASSASTTRGGLG